VLALNRLFFLFSVVASGRERAYLFTVVYEGVQKVRGTNEKLQVNED